jgi:hypothetical protein
VDWVALAFVATVPLALAVLAARHFWRRQQGELGLAIGTGIILAGAILGFANEYVRVTRENIACVDAGLTVCVHTPTAFMRYAICGAIAFAEVIGLFTANLYIEEREKNRNAWRAHS